MTMDASAASPTSVDLNVGQIWRIRVEADVLPNLVIVLPDGSTSSSFLFTSDGAGSWLAEYTIQDPGRHLGAVSVAGSGSLIFQAVASAVTMNAELPTFADLDDYLGGAGAHSWSDAQLTEALAVESAAQRRVCRVPAAYPDDLRAALLRRGARYLDMKRQLTEQPNTDQDFPVPPFVAPGRDQEIRRYEGPFRKLPIG